MKYGLVAAALMAVFPIAVAAQTPPNDDGPPLPPAAQATIDSFGKPLHPIIGGVAPSGGIGAGLGYTTPKGQDWFHNGEALVTVKKYWSVAGETGRQTQRTRLAVFATAREMNRLNFYGPGADSLRSDRVDFALRENSVGLNGWVRAKPFLRIGGSAQFYSPHLDHGKAPRMLSIEESYFSAFVPGVNDAPNFGRYRGFVELVYPVIVAKTTTDVYDSYQGTYQVAVESARDTEDGRFNFERYETEIQQRFPGFRPGQRLTVHGLLAATNSDGVVPFYLQYTLGGGGALKAFRADTIGTDGSKATLRSFPDYRFRDRNLLLLQAEYRVPLHKMLHATVFVDSGRVAPTVSDLFGGLDAGTGFSLSYMRKGAALARMDVGYGSGEGLHVFWGFGGFSQ
jgi:Omp85 superfamily domain